MAARTIVCRAALTAVLALVTLPAARAAERVDVTAMDGEQLIAELSGTSGPGIVLSPGADAVSPRWKSAAETIAARGFRVLRLEVRGAALDTDTAARDIEGAYRYLLGRKIRPVFLVGTDATTAAAMKVAVSVPVAGVAVLGATPKGSLPAVPLLVVPDDATDPIEALVRWLRARQGS